MYSLSSREFSPPSENLKSRATRSKMSKIRRSRFPFSPVHSLSISPTVQLYCHFAGCKNFVGVKRGG